VRARNDNLTVLAPVLAGHLDILRADLAALPAGDGSPFARVPGTHLARLTVVPGLDDRDLRPVSRAGAFLLFATDCDGDGADHVERLRGGLGEVADTVWGHCAGYPGRARARVFARWMLEHRVPVGFSVAPYRPASVGAILAAEEVQRRLVRFAARAPGLAPSERKATWLREFGDGRGGP